MNLQQFLLILKARYKVILGILFGTVATTLIVSFVLPAQYTAETSVVVDVKSPDPVAGLVLPAMTSPAYMATQVDILNSDRVAMKVVKLLKLDQNPQVQSDWKEETDGKGSVEVWLAGLLEKKLDVKPSRESNVITIDFKGSDPNFAATVANTFAQAYIDTVVELKVDPAKQYSAWFDKQSQDLRARLTAAQARLSDYQKKNGLVITDDRLDVETQKLSELQAQASQAEGQWADASSKQRSGGADTLPEVMQSGLIQQLRNNVAVSESKLKEMAGNLGANHPQYQRARAELVELKQNLADETARIATSIGTNKRISFGKIADLRAAVEAQKTRILELRKQRDEASVLLQDVATAQKAYESIAARYTQSVLESQATQTNVSVLTAATAPLEPSSPKILLNTVLAVFLGTMLAVGAALLVEMLDRRVRSDEDFADTEFPLLTELPAPSKRPKPIPVPRQERIASA
jgi:protein tyrosine kinase modulator